MNKSQSISPLQKVLLIPPMKGLNLYDSPFTMDSQFAEELVNFMPPTTVFQVRPGIQRLERFYGSVRGLISYSVGTTKSYGTHWYDQTITDGERNVLIIKMAENSGQTAVYVYNPLSFQNEIIARIDDNTYNKDYAVFKHYLMMCTGSTTQPMYIWSTRVGWQKMAWKRGDDPTKEMTDLENITYYNGSVFANGYNTLDIFYMSTAAIDPSGSAGWDTFFSWFRPTTNQATISLEGIVKNGGSILKLFTISQSGIENIQSYLCACTTNGEIVAFQGDVSDPVNPKWIVVGRFEIPIPLNKHAFCQMEGDMVVATANGIFSIKKAIFKQASEITNSMELRISKIFSDYMFTMSSFYEQIKLFYYPKNRLLIFNVPTQMSINFDKIKRNYEFTSEQSIMFPIFNSDDFNELINQMKSFVLNYLYYNWLNYTLFLQFNDTTGSNKEGIFIEFITERDNSQPTLLYACITTIKFWIRIKENPNSDEVPKEIKFMDDIIIKCNDFTSTNPNFEYTNLNWNKNFYKTYGDIDYYAYTFPDVPGHVWKITNIIPEVEFFAEITDLVNLLDFQPGVTPIEDLRGMVLYKYVDSDVLSGFPRDYCSFFMRMNYMEYNDRYHGTYPDARLIDGERFWTKSSTIQKHPMDNYDADLFFPNGITSGFNRIIKELMWNYNKYPNWYPDSGREDKNQYEYTVTMLTSKNRHHVLKYVFSFWYKNVHVPGESYALSIEANCRMSMDGRLIRFLRKKQSGDIYNNEFLFWMGIEGRQEAGYENSLFMAKENHRSDGNLITYFDYEKQTLLKLEDDETIENIEIAGNWVVSASGYGEIQPFLPNFTLTTSNYNQINRQFLFFASNVYFSKAIGTEPQPIPPEPIGPANFLGNLGQIENFPFEIDAKYATVDAYEEEDHAYDPSYDIFNFYMKINDALESLAGRPFGSTGAYLNELVKNIPEYPHYSHPLISKLLDLDGFTVSKLQDLYTNLKNFHNYKDTITYRQTMSLATGESIYLDTIFTLNADKQQVNKVSFGINIILNGIDGVPITELLDDDNNFMGDGLFFTSDLTYTMVIYNGNFEFRGWMPPTFNKIVLKRDSLINLNGKLNVIDFVGSYEPFGGIQLDSLFCNNFDDNFRIYFPTSHLSFKNSNVTKSIYYPIWSLFKYYNYNSFTNSIRKMEELPKKKIKIKPEDHKRMKALRGDEPSYQPTFAVQSANYDLNLIPLLRQINIVAPFRSIQYVMDSMYGTWSQWQDINISDAVVHNNEFYFVRPEDYANNYIEGSFLYNQSSLCKFSYDSNGDFGSLLSTDKPIPIKVSYKTASNNLQDNRLKQVQEINVHATASTFWGVNANNLRISVQSDFIDNDEFTYQHSYIPGVEQVLNIMYNKHGLRKGTSFKEFNHVQKQLFLQIYLDQSSKIAQGKIGQLTKPANRIGIKVQMDIAEHNIIIYGYELLVRIMNTF